MIKILFICHGNICRSPMAQFVLQHMVNERGLSGDFTIDSCAVSREELGNPVHPGTRRILAQHGIPVPAHRARQLQRQDYSRYDLLIAMEQKNLSGIRRIVGPDIQNKVHLLLCYTRSPGDIADPWYTGDFAPTYRDVTAGCQGLLQALGHI
ncbi:low molecular weight protein-tyrosine-phosphatase [Neobittarella massiliensis]|uniref:low molecular weight protein-tyrosine-phosphatase n=1 Tax=Neobittarella massiliensis (ex Bilen et al. 2018) TaxID=2041842 RepID=UPI000CF6C3D9|nr:low molecular weight protein-tyrosine-phosphatase [Neobittarella massiliensis]